MAIDHDPLDWERFDRDGYVRLGRLVDEADLRAMQQRIDAIMLGEADVDYDRLLMQLDTTSGDYADLGAQTYGFKGPSHRYRKVEGLETDPVFRSWVQHPMAGAICGRMHGDGVPIAIFRAMFMNKPASAGTVLPWHQDRWMQLDRDPLVTVYTALDEANAANGCMYVIAGSHHTVVNPSHPSAYLDEAHYGRHCPPGSEVALELVPGEVLLLHNWLIHRSGVNRSDAPRRAFSVCYMDGRTVDAWGARYPIVFDADGRPTDLDERTPLAAG